jgi:hypothetical protein
MVAGQGGDASGHPRPLYHLVQAPMWREAVEKRAPYFPPTYEQVWPTLTLTRGLLRRSYVDIPATIRPMPEK